MKKVIYLVVGLVAVIGVSSCNVCHKCTWGSISQEYCTDDFTTSEMETLETNCENSSGTWE